MAGDDQARRERAKRLHAEIEEVAEGERAARPPRSPREFIHEKMREREDEPPAAADRGSDAADDDRER